MAGAHYTQLIRRNPIGNRFGMVCQRHQRQAANITERDLARAESDFALCKHTVLMDRRRKRSQLGPNAIAAVRRGSVAEREDLAAVVVADVNARPVFLWKCLSQAIPHRLTTTGGDSQ